MDPMAALILEAPKGQIDPSLKPLIEKWDEVPKSIQILEALDKAIHVGGASGFAMRLFNLLYADALEREDKTHEDNIPLAVWRNDLT